MKKTMSAIIASILTASALPILNVSAVDASNILIKYDDGINNAHVFCDTDGDDVYETEIKKGDVNFDGKIDSSDSCEILEIYSELSTSNTYDINESKNILADYNGDGKIDSNDAVSILEIYANNSISDSENSVSLSKEVLNESITVDDVTIPAGATAFTVNVNNNKGFSLFDFVLEKGAGYDIITDSENRPVFSKCKTVNYNSRIESAVNNETVIINGLFGYDCLTDGSIITFYANENSTSDDKNMTIKSNKLYSSSKWREYGSGRDYLIAGCPLILNGETIERNPIENSSTYMVGDINGDMKIDLTDAFDAFYTSYAVANSEFESLQDVCDLCFPNIADVRAAFLWNEYDDSNFEMEKFTSKTATEILKYCADISCGKTHESDSYISEIRHIG